MLLGCCHCDGDVSSSSDVPSSSVPSSSTPSSDNPSIVSSSEEIWDCSACTVLPTKFVISGVDKSKFVHKPAYTDNLDCAASFDNGIILKLTYLNPIAPSPVPNGLTCAQWTSDEKAVNHAKFWTNPSPKTAHNPTCRLSSYADDWRWRLTLQRNGFPANTVKWGLQLGFGNDVNQFQINNTIKTWSYTWTETPTITAGDCVRAFDLTTLTDNSFGNSMYTLTNHTVTITPV